ncbi:MAG: adenosylcobinamide-phosphate synthase CbiB [Halobacteriota archaeon]
MPPVATAALGLAFGLELLFAEPPERIHPVALFGRLVGSADRAWSHPRTVGTAVALGYPALAAGVAGGLTALGGRHGPVVGVVIAGAALFSTVSLRMLVTVARDVIDLTVSDVDHARTEVSALVGRDATTLSPAEIRSGVVESASENLADGFVAPLSAFVLGAQVSLAVAVGCAVWVKAVNTLDSMLGYRSKPAGWASARLDDIVMWIPARLSAVLIAGASLDPLTLVRARAWVSEPPSPNSGWPMGALAAALDVRLRKPRVYTLNPAGRLPTVEQAYRGVRIVGVAGVLAAVSAGVLSWY